MSVAGACVCARQCCATGCEIVFRGGYSGLSCVAHGSGRARGEESGDVQGAGGEGCEAARINCFVSCGAGAVNVRRGCNCNKALWWWLGVVIGKAVVVCCRHQAQVTCSKPQRRDDRVGIPASSPLVRLFRFTLIFPRLHFRT